MYKILETSAFLSDKKRASLQKTASQDARLATGGTKVKGLRMLFGGPFTN